MTQLRSSPKPIVDPTKVAGYFRPYVPYAHAAADLHSAIARTGSFLHGHFELRSGQHSTVYFRFSRFASETQNVAMVANLINRPIADAAMKIDAVVSPDNASVILAYELARQLDVPRLVARTSSDGMPEHLLGSTSLKAGSRILMVSDVITTGRRIGALRRLVMEESYDAVGTAVFAVRRSKNHQRNWQPSQERLFALLELAAEDDTFGEPGHNARAECPLCSAGREYWNSDELSNCWT